MRRKLSTLKKPRLTLKHLAVLAKFGGVTRAKAKTKLLAIKKANREIRKQLAQDRRPATFRNRSIQRQPSLNTWQKEISREKVKLQYKKITRGPNKGMFRNRRDKTLVGQATLNRKIAAHKYWAQIRFLKEQLGGSSKNARQAYQAFKRIGLLRILEIES